MLSIAIDLIYGNSYTFRWGALKRDTAGQLGFARFFFPSSQNFTFQGDRVTFHSVLKRFYSRECHKYSLLRMWLDYLIPFFFFFFLKQSWGDVRVMVLRILFQIRNQMTFPQWHEYLTWALIHEAAVHAGETSLVGREQGAVSHGFPANLLLSSLALRYQKWWNVYPPLKWRE